MITELLFRDDAYLSTCEARVLDVGADGVVLDRTPFYARGGGQPGDSGRLETQDGRMLPVVDCTLDAARTPRLQMEASCPLAAGDPVICHIDWPRRYRHMRVHTALHLLSVLVPHPVTGGQIGDGEGRLDFDMPEASFDKDALSQALTALAARDLAVTQEWISDEEMAARPDLIKTMSVKPPTGQGRVRLIRIGDVDLQPCGGTHVASTGEIGPVAITRIEKKGRQNRRFRIALLD
ncbi:MAG: alanyl-tRNA editing protein [Hyphomicrobiaceae bacterium]|nr:alanyl-tRNA editing protein [Hyphomicrobiaceae bacterium]